MLFPSTADPGYKRGNSDAHRVRPASCVPPALISHQAFWISHKDQAKRREERHRVKCEIDDLILEIAGWTKQRHQVQVRIDPLIEAANILFANISYPDHLSIIQNSLRDGRLDEEKLTPAQRSVFESDHRVVSILFELNACILTIRFEFHTEYFSITTFAQIADPQQFGRRQQLEQLCSGQLQHNVEQIKRELYQDFWRDLTTAICPAGILKRPVFSRMFCDFRGIIISNDELLKRENTLRSAAEYFPVLSPIGLSDVEHECAACYMLGGRALYMTTLGLQVSQNSTGERDPVTYLLFVGQDTTIWQRGGLIDNLHSAGTCRLAALKDLSALRRAGGSLASLDSYTAAARSAVSEHRGQTSPSDRITQDQIGRAQDYFSAITSEFNAEVDGNYGVLYRVERSRYYVGRFRENARQTRIVRFDRFQKYNEFVERRLGATFDFIDRLGRRYERGVSALALLDSYNLSIQSNEIASGQKKTEEREANISDSIWKIQEYGDFVLVAALLPYYLTGLIAHIYGEEDPASQEKITYFACTAWTIAFVVAMCRTTKEESLFSKIRRALYLAAVAWVGLYSFSKIAPILVEGWLFLVEKGLSTIHWLALPTHPDL
jgi:hypothetical protein